MDFKHDIKKLLIFCIINLFTLVQPTIVAAVEAVKQEEFTIVLDPGHGGKDFGAIDNNVKEKDINLGVAKKLASKIKKGLKNVKVVMTRDNDTFISLQERADIANSNKGNLFISIHTNSVDKTNQKRKSIAGASVYALGLHKDKNNLQVAMRENSVIELEKNYDQKYSGFDPSKDESYIIFEMAQKKNLGQSLKFADLAQKSLVQEAGRADRGVKQAGFWVLWATSMPAVLVELDFICNPNSAIYMGSEKGQDQLADALYNAVKKYVDGNLNMLETVSQSEIEVPENIDEEAMHLLASSKKEEAKIGIENKGDKKKSALTRRRRRSETAKKASAIRNVETANIPLHSENDRLAIAETKSANIEIASSEEPIKDNNTKKSKGKSSKKSESKKNENNKNKSQVKNHQSISGYHPKIERLTTVYKIQILASEDRLKDNNPRFCGLSPIKSFKEKNLYKYTYGESENKKDMEILLKQVREKIPDAFIIKSMK